MHNILEDDDPETIDCKDEYNEALIQNKEVQILHGKMEESNIPINTFMDTTIDAGKLEEMKKNYDPNSEEIFNKEWDLSEDDTIVKNLYKDLSNLDIENISEKEDNFSIETFIQNSNK